MRFLGHRSRFWPFIKWTTRYFQKRPIWGEVIAAILGALSEACFALNAAGACIPTRRGCEGRFKGRILSSHRSEGEIIGTEIRQVDIQQHDRVAIATVDNHVGADGLHVMS